MNINQLQMNRAYLILGSNLGDKKEVIDKAVELLNSDVGKITKKSSYYETEPWGFETTNTFINQVTEINTLLTAEDLLNKALEIENKLGRIRNSKGYESRIIDIDILFYNEEIINQPNLIIPHPRLHERNFTLAPMLEVNADFVHPKLKKTIAELLQECQDTLDAKSTN